MSEEETPPQQPEPISPTEPTVAENSILTTTKKLLGIAPGYDAFDLDVLIHINSVFSTLHQLGVGPIGGYAISSDQNTWDEYIGPEDDLAVVKSYMYFRVKLMFDPPSNAFVVTSMEKQIEQLEWRMNVRAEELNDPVG